MSVFGTRLFGKVDMVPGMFHVATKGFHINFVPLIPLQSYLVLSKAGNQFRGVPVSLSLKSFAIAWLRLTGGLGLLVGLILILVAAADMSHNQEMLVPGIALSIIGAGVLVLSYKFKPLTHASYDRACRLAKSAGFTEDVIVQIQTAYGMTPTISAMKSKPAVPPRVPLPSQRRT